MIGNIDILVKELCKLPKEVGWIEFKHNNCAFQNTDYIRSGSYTKKLHEFPVFRAQLCYVNALLPSNEDVNAVQLSTTSKFPLPSVREALTNKSFRDRFNLKESSAGSISRLIKESVSEGRIKALDPDTAKRYMKYIPAWA